MSEVWKQELLTIARAAMADDFLAQAIASLDAGELLQQDGHEKSHWFEDSPFSHPRIFETRSFMSASEDMTTSSLGQTSKLICDSLMPKLAEAMRMESCKTWNRADRRLMGSIAWSRRKCMHR
ncbi:hypothetical protein F4778DRAFT_210824 [Xylariomycetidae sp. FL2044]|nr:hypothetical protein F4778DRAFT_210824 [Xylariomycetidae sp. FL2044]